MEPRNINANWAKRQSFKDFCKEPKISQLSKEKQKQLYETVTGNRVKVEKENENGGGV